MFTSLAVIFALGLNPSGGSTGVASPFPTAVSDSELAAARGGIWSTPSIREMAAQTAPPASLANLQDDQKREWWLVPQARLRQDEQPTMFLSTLQGLGFDVRTGSFSIQQVDYTPGGVATVNVDIKFGDIGLTPLLGQ